MRNPPRPTGVAAGLVVAAATLAAASCGGDRRAFGDLLLARTAAERFVGAIFAEDRGRLEAALAPTIWDLHGDGEPGPASAALAYFGERFPRCPFESTARSQLFAAPIVVGASEAERTFGLRPVGARPGDVLVWLPYERADEGAERAPPPSLAGCLPPTDAFLILVRDSAEGWRVVAFGS